ncbi:hypothetical protein MCEMSEM47_00267 [Burkholderiales bacterium]
MADLCDQDHKTSSHDKKCCFLSQTDRACADLFSLAQWRGEAKANGLALLGKERDAVIYSLMLKRHKAM